MTDYFPRIFLKDLDFKMLGRKVCVTGLIINLKSKEKFVNIWIDDNTAVMETILFKNADFKVDFQIGETLQITGEFDQDKYQAENIGRIKITKYSIIRDINLELHNYCATFYENKQKQILEEEKIDENLALQTSEPKMIKRFPLHREKLKTKLRTVIIKCLWQTRRITNSQQSFTVTYENIRNFPTLVSFCEKERINLDEDLKKIILELERLAFIYPVSQNPMGEELTYTVDLTQLDRLEEKMLHLIKPHGAQGISIDKLYEELNAKIDPEINVLSKEYIWEIANFLFEKNQIYLSKNDVLHYCERLF